MADKIAVLKAFHRIEEIGGEELDVFEREMGSITTYRRELLVQKINSRDKSKEKSISEIFQNILQYGTYSSSLAFAVYAWQTGSTEGKIEGVIGVTIAVAGTAILALRETQLLDKVTLENLENLLDMDIIKENSYGKALIKAYEWVKNSKIFPHIKNIDSAFQKHKDVILKGLSYACTAASIGYNIAMAVRYPWNSKVTSEGFSTFLSSTTIGNAISGFGDKARLEEHKKNMMQIDHRMNGLEKDLDNTTRDITHSLEHMSLLAQMIENIAIKHR